MIVIDNSSNSSSANENVRKDVVYFLTGLSQLAKIVDVTALLLAHVDEDAAKFIGHGVPVLCKPPTREKIEKCLNKDKESIIESTRRAAKNR